MTPDCWSCGFPAAFTCRHCGATVCEKHCSHREGTSARCGKGACKALERERRAACAAETLAEPALHAGKGQDAAAAGESAAPRSADPSPSGANGDAAPEGAADGDLRARVLELVARVDQLERKLTRLTGVRGGGGRSHDLRRDLRLTRLMLARQQRRDGLPVAHKLNLVGGVEQLRAGLADLPRIANPYSTMGSFTRSAGGDG